MWQRIRPESLRKEAQQAGNGHLDGDVILKHILTPIFKGIWRCSRPVFKRIPPIQAKKNHVFHT